MKTLRVFSVIILISLSSIGTAYSQSQIYSGNKSLREQKRIIRTIRGQISDYKLAINDEYRRIEYKSNGDSSLIASYRKKIDFLEKRLDDMIASMATKDTKQFSDLKSRDPRKVADAYVSVKYADYLYGANGNSGDQADPIIRNVEADTSRLKTSIPPLKGIIVSNWYYEVVAQVSGPGNFFREFNIKPNGKSPAFTLPSPGDYTTVFISNTDRKAITKKVGLNTIYYDGTATYAYKVTLLRY